MESEMNQLRVILNDKHKTNGTDQEIKTDKNEAESPIDNESS